MARSLLLKMFLVVAASLMPASLYMISIFSHEEDDPPGARDVENDGPKPGRSVEVPPGLIGLEVTLGLGNAAPTVWDGTIKVSQGRVAELEVVRSAPGSRVEGDRFHVAATKTAVAKNVKAKTKKKIVAKKAQVRGPAPVLRVNVDAPETATITIATDRGDFSFKPVDLAPGGRAVFLDGAATVERQFAAVRITGAGTEDDFPVAAKAPDGTIWLVDVEYRPEQARLDDPVKPEDFDRRLVPTRNGDMIRLRRFDGKTFHPAIDVTKDVARLDVWRPTVAVDGKGIVHIAWAEQLEGDWEIYHRAYTPAKQADGQGRWSDTERVTNAKGSDFHVVSTTDGQGTVWIAWQAFRGDNYEIMACALADDHPDREPFVVSSSPSDDWSPAIAADIKGSVFVAWDTYDKGNFDVLLRDIGKRGSKPVTVADSARFEARPSLVCDKESRLWIAYEEGDEQWGKDYASSDGFQRVGLAKNPGFALYVNRTVRIKCLDAGKLMRLTAGSELNFGELKSNRSVPRLATDDHGGVWLFVRHHPGGGGEVWVGSFLRFDGDSWSTPRRLAASTNLIDNRPALAAVGDGLLAVYSCDRRTSTQNRREDDLYAARLGASGTIKPPKLEPDVQADAPKVQAVHPNEIEDVARLRDYRIQSGGQTLRPIRGEFHRHSEISSHADQDGLLEDMWRYALDAVHHDWMGNGDHDNGFGHEYMWWLVQKTADIHNNETRFVAAQTYERSVVYPNGHRNVMAPRRGIRPLPRGELPGTAEAGAPDTKLLYKYLKHFDAICASHTSATNMGTDWRDNDPEVEPVVEIYQGHRHNYEHPGAPRSPTAETEIGGFQPAGFVWNALAKGYKLGFESSSDHVSTHWSYAIVFASERSRRGIIEAFKKRHCYAATDNILLDVRSGEHMMGDTFKTDDKPTLKIGAHGTSPIVKIHVIRDDKYALTVEPNEPKVSLVYTDDDAEPGGSHYYYVRVEQADGNLAWGSPMWITRSK